MARRSARAVLSLESRGITMSTFSRRVTAQCHDGARGFRRLDKPDSSHSGHRARAGLRRPTVDDWTTVNRKFRAWST
jgi:hypothetical protein